MYIERGINRHVHDTQRAASSANDKSRSSARAEREDLLAEYRQARLASERRDSYDDLTDGEALPDEDNRAIREDTADASPVGRFLRRARTRREERHWDEDEQPPLLDTLAENVEKKYNNRQEFRARYDRSTAGASTVKREVDEGGAVVREVEYFVPKLSGDNAKDINYGKKKRRTRNTRPMRRWEKASLTTVSLMLAFLMVLGLAFSALLNRMNFVQAASSQSRGGSTGGGQTLTVEDMEADKAAAQAAEGINDNEIELPDAVMFDADIENVLLIGSDRRAKDEDGRSDAMMLLTIDRKHKKIKMTSFLRDLYIKIPGRYGTKLNSAYAVGGVDMLKQTIEANLGITVDKYIIVDFNAFKTVVNKIGKVNGKGGIKITVTSAEARYMCNHEKYGLFPRFSKGKGTYYMNGAEALNYARIRKIDSDFGRTKRQRKVLTEIISELKGLGYMDLINIGYSCLEYVTTDFTKAELVGLATEATSVMNYDNAQISIPVKGSYTVQHMSNGNEVLAANLKVNATILSDFIYKDDMKYEGNNKEVHGIFLPDLKGIANSNVTTKKHETTSTTAAGGGTTVTDGGTTVAGGSTTAPTSATSATSTTKSKSGTLEIVGNNVIVRSKNSSSSDFVTRVQNGERYPYTDVKGSWYQITLPSGKKGWVYGKYIIALNNAA